MTSLMTPHEKECLIQSLQRAIEAAQQLPTTTGCMDCGYYQSGNCVKWREVIPQETLETGCDAWVFNRLSPPF